MAEHPVNVPAELRPEPPKSDLDGQRTWLHDLEKLEHHTRNQIDRLLAGLGWAVQSTILSTGSYPGGMAEEVGARPPDSNRKRMDYFGYECNQEHLRPLLVVEAKGPLLSLPNAGPLSSSPHGHAMSQMIATYLTKQVRRRSTSTQAARLSNEWCKCLDEVRNYVLSCPEDPGLPRLAITNSEWMIVFEDPDAAFRGNDLVDHSKIVVFPDRAAMGEHASTLWNLLAYQSLSRESAGVDIPQLPACPR